MSSGLQRWRIVRGVRHRVDRYATRLRDKVRELVLRAGRHYGFLNLYYYQVHGPADRLHLHPTVSTQNTLFNTRSGHITVGAGTILAHNCMVLTGRHLFEDGRLKMPKSEQVPESGFDITIGEGCWIASGSLIVGGVRIGDHCIVMAGAVVTRDVEDGGIVGGVPAAPIRSLPQRRRAERGE